MSSIVVEREQCYGYQVPLDRSAEFTNRVQAHPFLVRCRQGSVEMFELENFLIQHGKYSAYFTRYLCALMSQLEDGKDVLALAENLSEELGYGDDGGVPHSKLYAELLADFGLSPDRHLATPETQNLIDTMFMLCRQPAGLAGLGALCLAAEAIVPAVYSSVVQGFESWGINRGRLKFFTIHIECDDGHADTMRSIIQRKTRASASNELAVISAAEIAIDARLRFFDALSREVP